jgi:hypothetical protein
MSRSQLRIMRPNETMRFALVRLLRSKGFSHIPAACQPAKIFKMGFGLEQGSYRLSIARDAKERARYSARLHPSRK